MRLVDKKLILFLLCILTLCKGECITIALMVKNEQDVIESTLKPFIGQDEISFLIYDTGSTDDTVNVAQRFFEKHAIERVCIIQEPFVDFATSRNRALQLAQEHFPHTEFLLMPDAEWYMENTQNLITFCKEKIALGDNSDSYLVLLKSGYSNFYSARLIRAGQGVQFVGVVHEVLDRVTTACVPEDIYFDVSCISQKGIEKSRERWKRDKFLLLKELQKKPRNARTLFYLAQTYDCLKEYEHAYQMYKQRSTLHGWDEENYMTLYRMAQVLDKLPHSSWAHVLACYLKAFQYRPTRAEPLVKIAEHYFYAGDYKKAHFYAEQACQIPYPSTDILFVDRYLYDHVRYEILSKSSDALGAAYC